MNANRFGDLVVLLPGITGSVLRRDGRDVWAPTPQAALTALLTLGRSVDRLALEGDDWQADDLGDGIVASRLMPEAHLLANIWKIDGYTEIETFLTRTLGLTRGDNYRPYPYDWRRDIRAAARRLLVESRGWLKHWRQKSGNDQAQLVLVGHSMGGLVSRYYVEALGGWQDTKAVITFGTPFYGSLNALEFLCNGLRKRLGPFHTDLSELLRSFTSLHQLVPVYRCVYGTDGSPGTPVMPAEARLPNWQPKWSRDLLSFQSEMERAAAANRQDPAWAAHPVVYRPILGVGLPTGQSAHLADGPDAPRAVVRHFRGSEDQDEGGDGTVPKLSAALSGSESASTFAAQPHASLQTQRPLLDHLKGVLESLDDISIDDLRGARGDDLREGKPAWFGYRSENLYLPDQPVSVELSLNNADGRSRQDSVAVEVTVSPRAPQGRPTRHSVTVTGSPLPIDLGLLTPGAYDIRVTSGPDVGTLSDVLVVGDREGPQP
ncbi:hypothetical protein ACFW1A_30920 [Kitasatospora sp. NPDC058965]|uniref:lipase/acyltransferase domain-containing protein n=1 Tax=Kitasatospora sp. NPDC058965 TaxID=3346682 RepID=UPI00368FBED1